MLPFRRWRRPETRKGPLQWLASAGGVLALLAPKGLCPICVAASGGVLSAIGLGFLAVDATIRWVLPAVLFLGLLSLFFAARRHRYWWVLGLAGAGATVLYVGWLSRMPAVLYGGMVLLAGASVLNFWSQRHPRPVLVQLGKRKVGAK